MVSINFLDLCAYAHKPLWGYFLNCYLLFCEDECFILDFLEDEFCYPA